MRICKVLFLLICIIVHLISCKCTIMCNPIQQFVFIPLTRRLTVQEESAEHIHRVEWNIHSTIMEECLMDRESCCHCYDCPCICECAELFMMTTVCSSSASEKVHFPLFQWRWNQSFFNRFHFGSRFQKAFCGFECYCHVTGPQKPNGGFVFSLENM